MPSASLSPAALAYLGDAVCELCVRELLVGLGFTSFRAAQSICP